MTFESQSQKNIRTDQQVTATDIKNKQTRTERTPGRTVKRAVHYILVNTKGLEGKIQL